MTDREGLKCVGVPRSASWQAVRGLCAAERRGLPARCARRMSSCNGATAGEKGLSQIIEESTDKRCVAVAPRSGVVVKARASALV